MVESHRPTDTELLFLSIPFGIADRERSDSFIKLLESGPDWSCLEEKLINCRLSGFFLRNANNANVSHLIPEHIREHFSSVMKKDLVNNLLYLEAFKELSDVFKKNNIDFIVLKGMALYFTVYAASRFRFMFDIDLLVKEEQYEEAKRVLGYKDQEGYPRAPHDFDV
ncbi:MAG: nucleotidyltransferase family protein, partial [Candidatus Omnitrophota bacterium]